jgi:transposase-like protein
MAAKTNKKVKRLEELKIEDSGLTLKQEAVAVALALGQPVKDIAAQYDISITRIYEWRQMSEFASYLKRIQRDAVREIRGQLSTMKDAAVSTIQDIMENGKEETRLKAACYVLDSIIGDVKDAKKLRAQAKKLNEKART